MHAPHSLRVREQRAPAARVAIFSPSVCLSAFGFVRLQRRPSAPRHQLGPELPSASRGPVQESPGPAGPSCGPGPIVRGSVCPEAGPRDPERRGAPRRRVKRPPTLSLRDQAEDAGAPRPLPWSPAVGPFVSLCLGRGTGARSGLGGGGRLGSDPPPAPGSRDEAGPGWLPTAAVPLSVPLEVSGAGGASASPPSPRGPRSGSAGQRRDGPGV